MVVFASGIVDEDSRFLAGRSQYYPFCGCGTWVAGGGWEVPVMGPSDGVGTLLGPEGSREALVGGGAGFLLASFAEASPVGWGGGVGGCGVWLLNSGREHLVSQMRVWLVSL
jgi:hypothetical protein